MMISADKIIDINIEYTIITIKTMMLPFYVVHCKGMCWMNAYIST